MKVLLIDVNCKYSSTGKIVYDLYRKLLEEGHDAAICYGRGKLIQEHNIYKFGVDWETFLHAGLSRITGLNGCYSPISTRRLIKYIENFNPDVVHIHELHAYFVNIKPLINYLKKKKKKIVWTFHCEYMYTGKCGHAYDCMNFTKECGNCPAVKEYPKSLFLDRTRKMFREKKKMLEDLDFTIVTPSKWLADRVKMSFLKNKHIEVIHNGVDTNAIFYRRSEKEIQSLKEKYFLSGKKIVLAVAPNIMDERKGGKIVLKISNEIKDKNIQFVLVGNNETKKYSENVLLVAKTKDQNELAVWYSAADVFLICSKRENFPTTCVEAICCGTPIVGIDEGGTKETAIVPYGIFLKNPSTKDLANAVLGQLVKEISGNEIAEWGVRKYTKDMMYKKYLNIYK